MKLQGNRLRSPSGKEISGQDRVVILCPMTNSERYVELSLAGEGGTSAVFKAAD
jgi:hypothetical protein